MNIAIIILLMLVCIIIGAVYGYIVGDEEWYGAAVVVSIPLVVLPAIGCAVICIIRTLLN